MAGTTGTVGATACHERRLADSARKATTTAPWQFVVSRALTVKIPGRGQYSAAPIGVNRCKAVDRWFNSVRPRRYKGGTSLATSGSGGRDDYPSTDRVRRRLFRKFAQGPSHGGDARRTVSIAPDRRHGR